MSFNHLIQTRYSETAQDGIIHHSSYVVYLEVARIEFFKSLGCSLNELEKKKIFCPVVALSLQYLKPLHSSQDIVVQITAVTFSKVRFCLKYQVLLEKICVATATTTHCFVNQSFKPTAIPKPLLEQFRKYENLPQ